MWHQNISKSRYLSFTVASSWLVLKVYLHTGGSDVNGWTLWWTMKSNTIFRYCLVSLLTLTVTVNLLDLCACAHNCKWAIKYCDIVTNFISIADQIHAHICFNSWMRWVLGHAQLHTSDRLCQEKLEKQQRGSIWGNTRSKISSICKMWKLHTRGRWLQCMNIWRGIMFWTAQTHLSETVNSCDEKWPKKMQENNTRCIAGSQITWGSRQRMDVVLFFYWHYKLS